MNELIFHKVHNPNKNAKLCTAEGNDCFWIKMANYTYMNDNCYCLPNCNTVKFPFNEKQLPIDVENECMNSRKIGYNMIIYKAARTLLPHTIIQDNIGYRNNYTIGNWKDFKSVNYKEFCKTILRKDIALVHVQIDGQTFVKLKQSLRVTIADKFGSIGGTLGLFCGFSILAAFEVVFWILKALNILLCEKKCTKDIQLTINSRS